LQFDVLDPEVRDRIFLKVILYDLIQIYVDIILDTVGFGAVQVMVFLVYEVIAHDIVGGLDLGYYPFIHEHVKDFIDGAKGDMREVQSKVVDDIIG
jgi:hypothetical protein